MESKQNAKEVVLNFINALNKEDFETARNCLSEDMVFDGVLGHRDGADVYIKEMEKMKFKYEIKKAFENGTDVCLLYDIDMGNKKTTFTCGWYQLQNGKIKNLKVVFDPRPVLEQLNKKWKTTSILNALMKSFNHHSGQYLSIDNAKIYYETAGNENKPALLFLHGGFGNIEDFNKIISLLKNDYRIIGIDSRGQGKSTLGNVKLSYEIIQKDIEAICNYLKIETLNIIGISDGGTVAYRLACFSKLKILKLITIGSRWHSSNVADTKDVLQKVTVNFWKEKHAETVEIYEKLNPSPDFEKLTPLIVNMWLNEASYPNEKLKNIKCDTLIIHGDKDNLIKRKFVFELADLIPNSNLLNIPFANHVVYTEQPEILMHSINEFLD